MTDKKTHFPILPDEPALGAMQEEASLNPPKLEDPNAARGLAAVVTDLQRMVRLGFSEEKLEAGLEFLDRREGLALTPKGKQALMAGLKAGQAPEKLLPAVAATGGLKLPKKP